VWLYNIYGQMCCTNTLAEIPSRQKSGDGGLIPPPMVVEGPLHVNQRPTHVTRVDLKSILVVLNTCCVLFCGAVFQHESTWRHPSKNGNTKICEQTWLGSSGINLPTCIVWKLRLGCYEFHICVLVVHIQITVASANNMHLQITFASACHQHGDSASSVHATSVYTCPAEHMVC